MITITMRNGTPAITLSAGQYLDEGQRPITESRARQMIQEGTCGDPTRAAVTAGTVSGAWPYRLADESAEQFAARTQ